MKTEIDYGFEKEYVSFNAFVVAIEEYINYYNNRRIQKKQNGCPL
ncbi:IS3 family transposase [Veillonella parvula]|nr:IS3 family transposase [Veillonella parvula]